MKNTTLLFVLVLWFVSCKDQGENPQYIGVVGMNPAQNELNVDKGRFITIEFDRDLHRIEFERIRLRYVDDTTTILNYVGCGLTPSEVRTTCLGPFIWKPGKTVEVFIPRTLSDPAGHGMKEDLTYRFSIAHDSVPFQLIGSRPRHGDTISVSAFPYGYHGQLTFDDYLPPHDSILTITPPARIHSSIRIIVDGRNTPERALYFVLENLSANARYEIVIPQHIRDYEGETLPQAYRVVFYTKP